VGYPFSVVPGHVDSMTISALVAAAVLRVTSRALISRHMLIVGGRRTSMRITDVSHRTGR
jgi:hypothetical protein